MEHRFISKRYWKDITTPMGDVDRLAKEFNDVIDLSLGDPDLTTDRVIIEGAFEDALEGHTKYTAFRGDPELRNEIVKYYDENFGLTIADQEIMVVTSGCLAMYLTLEAILDEGDEVIIHAPYFTPYKQQIELARGIPIIVDTYEEEKFQINPLRLEKAITNKTKAIIINTPNNPTGACLSKITLEQIAEIAQKHDLIVIADEIYGAFSYSEPFKPFITINGMRERTITINSFSKDFTMTGWRIGYVIAPECIVTTIQQINENVAFTAPSISQRGGIHALRNRKNIQPAMIEKYHRRVLRAADRINEIPGFSVLPVMGTFYLFVNIKETGLTSREACEVLLNEAHVLTIPGTAFGNCGEGYLRIACTVQLKKIDEAFDRIVNLRRFKND
jgi:aspartate/methionine/tyrosine aminotransferase